MFLHFKEIVHRIGDNCLTAGTSIDHKNRGHKCHDWIERQSCARTSAPFNCGTDWDEQENPGPCSLNWLEVPGSWPPVIILYMYHSSWGWVIKIVCTTPVKHLTALLLCTDATKMPDKWHLSYTLMGYFPFWPLLAASVNKLHVQLCMCCQWGRREKTAAYLYGKKKNRAMKFKIPTPLPQPFLLAENPGAPIQKIGSRSLWNCWVGMTFLMCIIALSAHC